MKNPEVVLETNIPELTLFARGKVRDVYELPPYLLIVTTDRLSAFDVIMADGIPYKGRVLTALSAFWFDLLKSLTPNHLVTTDLNEIIKLKPELHKYATMLKDRVMLVRKSKVFPVECVVRGYLAGSGWKEYRQNGTICGEPLPPGLTESARLDQPIFTPSTKAVSGHDENISYARMQEILPVQTAQTLRERSIAVYQTAHKYALAHGIIISDTKFEWGYPLHPAKEVSPEEIILVDEVLTPDSSRFWPKDRYQPGRGQPSFDKQFVRDYLESINWNKTPPPPKLPDGIIQMTSEKYLEAYQRLTGKSLVS